MLAFWAEMGATPSQKNAADGSAAGATGLASSEIDTVFELEESALAFGIDIVGNG